MSAPRRIWLREMAAAIFLPVLPAELVASLDAQGMALQPRTKPVISTRGEVAVRLVWRHRGTGGCVVVTWTLRGSLPDTLLDALDVAMMPPAALMLEVAYA